MTKTKVVVTGGSGFIGSNLIAELERQNYEVENIDLVVGRDIRKLDQIKPLFVGAKYVFHLAALPRVQYSIEHPVETNETNVIGTLNVLLAAKEAGVAKVIYSASSSAYGDQEIMPLVETLPAKPKSPYGLQKYIGEMYARVFSEVYNLPTVSLRYFNVYGPGQNPDGAYALVIGKFIKQKKEGQPLTITGDGEQTRDFTHVRDVVRANILAAESDKVGKGEVLNIGAGRNFSVNKIAELVGGEKEYLPARLEPKHTLADNRLAKELLGWEPQVKLEDGIKELLHDVGL